MNKISLIKTSKKHNTFSFLFVSILFIANAANSDTWSYFASDDLGDGSVSRNQTNSLSEKNKTHQLKINQTLPIQASSNEQLLNKQPPTVNEANTTPTQAIIENKINLQTVNQIIQNPASSQTEEKTPTPQTQYIAKKITVEKNENFQTNKPALLAKIETRFVPDTSNTLKNIQTQPIIIQKQEKIIKHKLSNSQRLEFRELFLQAEKFLKKNDESNFFSTLKKLKNYPLHPYLNYQWLINNLDEDEKIKTFLKQEKDSRYAKLLKTKWLYHLARNKAWNRFLIVYKKTKSKTLQCYFLQAQIAMTKTQVVLKEGEKLWLTGHSQPKTCDPVFAYLQQTKHLTQKLLWQRFYLALQNNNIKLAHYVKNFMAEKYEPQAQLWLDIHQNPNAHINNILSRKKTKQNTLMFAHTITRLMEGDEQHAIQLWDKNKSKFNVGEKLAQSIEKKLAFKLVLRHKAGAYQRMSQLVNPKGNTKTWLVRAALLEKKWPQVIVYINKLSKTQQKTEQWQYWLARALFKTGKKDEANKIFSQLAKYRSYYGFLAADIVHKKYQLISRPIDVLPSAITYVEQLKQFQVAFELKQLNKTIEAKSQWWFALRNLNKKYVKAAAKLAQQWQWSEVAIFSIAKVGYWDDVSLRFPLSFSKTININAKRQKLNPIILYGIIRRESAFNQNARSSVGASGLMQIMPKTGQHIARDFKEKWQGKAALINPETNIRYGAYYYQKLLSQFNGHFAVALAAYNAGPHNAKKWLPKTKNIPADIWIETIPYHETRGYVSTVLSYAMIYQLRLRSKDLTMKQLAGDISPITHYALSY